MAGRDYQAFVDVVDVPCAVLSVARGADGGCGEIRIVCANDAYRQVMGPAYQDGILYQDLVPQDLKFEEYCYRAAFKGERMHAYVQTQAFDTWTDLDLIPLKALSSDLGICQFVFQYTHTADPDRLSTRSLDIASSVINASVTLLSAPDCMEGVSRVLDAIREMSGARTCCIQLADHERKETSCFAKSVAADADELSRVQEHIPYGVVEAWEQMIGLSDALIIKDAHDRERLREQNPSWDCHCAGRTRTWATSTCATFRPSGWWRSRSCCSSYPSS